MKLKHNKKRNPAFLFEVLLREVTKNAMHKKQKEKVLALNLIKEFFKKGTELSKELALYTVVLNAFRDQKISSRAAESILYEAKNDFLKLNLNKTKKQKDQLISKINKSFPNEVFSNFVPNYKNLATIYQIFGSKLPIRKRVLLERKLIDSMSMPLEQNNMESIDSLVYKTFAKKFNEVYGGKLMPEQNKLIEKYIMAFQDNGVDLKLFLNGEVARLKQKLTEAKEQEEIKKDKAIFGKVSEVLVMLESFARSNITQKDLIGIMKVQSLIKEIES